MFIDTWMARRHRARAERLRRDGLPRDGQGQRARSTTRSASSSEGTKIDFQVEVNSYLYGTRFMTWLAYQYSPEKLIEWSRAVPGSRALLRVAVPRTSSASRSKSAWAEWIAFESEFQQANLAAIRKYPVTPATDLSTRALGSISRAYYDAGIRTDLRGLQLPRRRRARRRDLDDDAAQSSTSTDIKGPRIYQVASLAVRSRKATRSVLHDRQRRRTAISCGSTSRRAARAAAEGPARRRPGLQSRRPVALGHPSPERHRVDREDGAAVHATGRAS